MRTVLARDLTHRYALCYPWIGFRQANGENGTPPRPALHRDGPAVRLCDPLSDGQTQTCTRPGPGPGTRRIGPPESLEDVRQIAGSNPDAGVANREGDPVGILF